MKNKLLKGFMTLAAVMLFCMIPSVSAHAELKTMPDGGQFDPSFYAATYPDVYAACGMNEALLYQHYQLFGIAEKRLPYAGAVLPRVAGTSPSATIVTMPDGGLFDPVFYARKYPDVVAIFGNHPNVLYTHYLYFGAGEGRLPYEGATKPSVKLNFTTVGAIANVNSQQDVIYAVRQAGQFRVTQLTILAKWNGELSSETITSLTTAQSTFLKNAYGARVSVSDPMLYGNVDDLTIEVTVTMKF